MSNWQRSCDHLLYGPAADFVAKGKDWATTEMIRRKLDAGDDMLSALQAQEAADKANEGRAGYGAWQKLEDAAKALRVAAIAKATGESDA